MLYNTAMVNAMSRPSEILTCDRCHLAFLSYEGYEEIKGEGLVCSYCIEEEIIFSEDNEKVELE